MSHVATEGYASHRSALLTLREAAEYLRIDRATLYRLIRAGELTTVRVGKRQRLRPEEIDAYLERGSP